MSSSTKSILIFFALALLTTLATLLARADDQHGPPPLALGSPAPDFCLPGIDGKTHCLADYAPAKVLVIVFTCDHCPTAQLYETRIKQLAADYKDRGVALIAIQPNNPMAVRLDEMGYTDVGDSPDDMKIRAAYRHFNFPYLYDGDDQKISREYGPAATPHVFIFDAQSKLRYEGRVDNNPRANLVTRQDAREAIDAILATNLLQWKKLLRLAVPPNGSTKKKDAKPNSRKLKASLSPSLPPPPTISKCCAKMIPANFASSTSGPPGAPPAQEMPEIQTMLRMYGHRAFEVVTVSITIPTKNPPPSLLFRNYTLPAEISSSVPPTSTRSSALSTPTGTPPSPTPCSSNPTAKSPTRIRAKSIHSNFDASSSPIFQMTTTWATKPTGNLNRLPNLTNILRPARHSPPTTRRFLYRAVHPPSINIVSPVISDAAGDARNTTAPATSTGSPMR